VRLEEEQLEWLEAADPRVALRVGRDARAEVVAKVGTEAVLAEDPDGVIRGASLDLFAFRSRERVLERAALALKASGDPLPELGPVGSALARPRLEYELLGRFIDEETARAHDEAKLGDASADLVQGMVSTWTPPAAPQDWPDRDAWVAKRLLQIRDSLRRPGEHLAPTSLDVALYPLERLLAPLQFPKGSAAVAEVRMAIDADTRAVPRLSDPDRLARAVRTHLGLTTDVAQLPHRLAALQQKIHALAVLANGSSEERRNSEQRARELLMAEGPCPAVPDSPVRTMGPPPERAASCGVLRALSEEEHQGAVLLALHDDVLLAQAAVVNAPPPRTEMLSHPADDVVDALERMARERPVVALGAALAVEIVFAGPASPAARAKAWRELGEAPLDVVARELEHP
jgi:hypothetical protein